MAEVLQYALVPATVGDCGTVCPSVSLSLGTFPLGPLALVASTLVYSATNPVCKAEAGEASVHALVSEASGSVGLYEPTLLSLTNLPLALLLQSFAPGIRATFSHHACRDDHAWVCDDHTMWLSEMQLCVYSFNAFCKYAITAL